VALVLVQQRQTLPPLLLHFLLVLVQNQKEMLLHLFHLVVLNLTRLPRRLSLLVARNQLIQLHLHQM
jgi:hypothetical protein